MSWISIYSDWLLALAAGIAGLGTGAIARIDARTKNNKKRSLQNKRQLQGDPKDPNAEGVLQIANETRTDLNEFYTEFHDFRRETKRDHQRVIQKLEEMNGEHE